MKHKIPKVIILSALLLFAVTLTAPAQATPSSSNPEFETELFSISTNLSAQQKDEIERIIDDRLERSATVSDRIQSTVNGNFGLLFALAGLTISALGAIPVFSGAVIFIFRRTILEGIEKTITKELLKTGMQEILEDEVKKQLSDQVEEELRSKIKQKLTELEQQATCDLSEFKDQLARVIAEVEKDKREYVAKLTSLDLNIVREAAARAAADKIADLIKSRPPLPLISGWRKH
jgi:Rps23 Pro-64 3,4-dihydroxylase Tpa1-like proline 4-hydroxylase